MTGPMRRSVFLALVEAERARHGSTWPVPLSPEQRDLIESVWQWSQDVRATIQQVQEELKATMADELPQTANSKGGGFLRVIREYDG